MPARSVNKVTLIGNLTQDPTVRYTGKGTAVASFGVATSRSWVPSGGGDKVDRTEFHNIVAWAQLAEICEKLLGKGDKVYLEGRLEYSQWENDQGEKRNRTEINISDMMLLRSVSGKASENYGSSDEGSKSSKSKSKKQSNSAEEPADAEDISDDIPF